jgi:NAD(P)-dependent dehydrogenase (short-subunit alcohol dehydrogenase family)
MELSGKVAIVTGAGRGIGRATALAPARRGVVVVLVARTRPEIEAVAAEVKRFGIDVNGVCPSGTDTRMLHETGRAKGRTNLIRPEEIASVIAFLVSPESSAITGTAIEAYGLGNPLFGPLLPPRGV